MKTNTNSVDKMKIFQIIPHLGSGGAERFVVDLSNELSKMGHDVILCTLYILEGPYGFYRTDISPAVRTISLNKKPGLSVKAVIKFIQLVHREKPDVIHSHINALQYSAISQIFQSKGVHTIHNEAHLEATGFLELTLRRILFRLRLIQPITISKESDDSFFNFYHKHAQLIYNGRAIGDVHASQQVKDEIKQYKKNISTRVIVQLARFQKQKNIPMMARVAKRLSDEGYNFTLLFIGNTDNTAILNEVLAEKPDCAHVLGERHNPLEYLMEAGYFALSSSFEGMPISLIEALGVGAIPVCTPAGGIPNVITDGYNGILAKDISEEAFYKAMKTYLELSDHEVQSMRQHSLKSYEPYSMAICAKKYEEVYMNKCI